MLNHEFYSILEIFAFGWEGYSIVTQLKTNYMCVYYMCTGARREGNLLEIQ